MTLRLWVSAFCRLLSKLEIQIIEFLWYIHWPFKVKPLNYFLYQFENAILQYLKFILVQIEFIHKKSVNGWILLYANEIHFLTNK